MLPRNNYFSIQDTEWKDIPNDLRLLTATYSLKGPPREVMDEKDEQKKESALRSLLNDRSNLDIAFNETEDPCKYTMLPCDAVYDGWDDENPRTERGCINRIYSISDKYCPTYEPGAVSLTKGCVKCGTHCGCIYPAAILMLAPTLIATVIGCGVDSVRGVKRHLKHKQDQKTLNSFFGPKLPVTGPKEESMDVDITEETTLLRGNRLA